LLFPFKEKTSGTAAFVLPFPINPWSWEQQGTAGNSSYLNLALLI
jgi:hypothetical protein